MSMSGDEFPVAGSVAGGGGGAFAPSISSPLSSPSVRKPSSYSQPLISHTPPSLSSRRSSHRNHSLDDNRSSSLHFLPSPSSSAGDFAGGSGDNSLTLEMAMSEYGGAPGTLPEFTGGGGGRGAFRVPLRAPMHPSRPPCVELRPHPLRETQAGSFLRGLVASGNRIWAGSESGLRMWALADMWGTHENGVRRGDESSAPFYETGRVSPVMCLEADRASGVVWTGHRDGKIRSWKMDWSEGGSNNGTEFEEGANNNVGGFFREGLSWQAHPKGPVSSLGISSYGDLWSGSENGALRAWPWDTIEKSLSLKKEERHMASLLVERSYVDLRNQVTINGICPLPASDVKYIVADRCKSRIWTVTSVTFALWDARTRELLKVFGIDGQEVTRVEAPPPQLTAVHESQSFVDDDIKVKFVSTSKKEKSKENFFQRSRNALMGAADAVRRVATKGSFQEDNRRIGAISASFDGTIWTGFTNGSLAQWDGSGTRLQEFQHHLSSVQSICPFTDRLWIGYASGIIQLTDLDGNLLSEWVAHSSPVIDMAVAGDYLFSLGHHGGVRGWGLMSPGPVDDVIRDELSKRELVYTKNERIKIMAGTWNVGQEKAGHDSLISWLGSTVSDVGLVVVGLQEVEMGAGVLAMSAAKESVGLEGSNNGQWWLDSIGKTLDEGSTFQRVGSRQLAGLLIGAWARKSLRPHIGDVDAAAIPTGIGRALGNKGAVGLRMRVYDRTICFVNNHFAAHLEAINKRNADFDHIFRNLSFSRPSAGVQGAQSGATSVQLHRAVNTSGTQTDTGGTPELSEADMVVFMGDFNYRLHSITYDEARDMVSQRCFDWLREKDQLRVEMKAGRVFQGMREAHIKFPPTYKFQRHHPGLGGYDSGEKKRIPAWCDRILYRDTRSISLAECSLECPVVASITHYDACMDVTDSDHKPVRCKFNVEIARVDKLIKRQEHGQIIQSDERIKALLKDSQNVPETVVSTNNIILQHQETTLLRLSNKCDEDFAAYRIVCEGQKSIQGDSGDLSKLLPRGSFGFPVWLEVTPATGIIKPRQTIEITIRHEEYQKHQEYEDGIPQNWWSEDTRDKELVLLINITGTKSTSTITHKIHVRYCYPSKENSTTMLLTKEKSDKRRTPSRRISKNHLQRSEVNQLDGSDMAEFCQRKFDA